MKTIRTSDMARAAGVHPNTIRAYEELGLISKAPRKANGYRVFSELHLDQVKLIRIILNCTYLGGRILDTAYGTLYSTAEGKLSEALDAARLLLRMIEKEREQAEEAFDYLESWANGTLKEDDSISLRMKEAAKHLDVTTDMLYNWERNGLIRIPRRADNGYREYGAHELNRLRVIRMLRKARFGNMAILRVMLHLDNGCKNDLKTVLDTPVKDDDIRMPCFSDNWLSALKNSEDCARKAVEHLRAMVKKYA